MQSCKFQVGSYSYDDTKMIFLESPRVKGYIETSRSIVLDYDVHIASLKQSDRILTYGSLGNYSLAGFQMVRSGIVCNGAFMAREMSDFVPQIDNFNKEKKRRGFRLTRVA